MSLDTYLKELADESEPLREARLTSLSRLTKAERDLLAEMWPSFHPARRQHILSNLTSLAEENIELDFTLIFQLGLNDTSPEVRALAIQGLWECEDRWLISSLIQLLRNDPAEKVRAAAAIGLGRFALLAELGKLLDKDSAALMNVLLETIQDGRETTEVRRRAVEALAPLNLAQTKEIISKAYESADIKMRASALYAMGRNCDPQWLPLLHQALESREPELRYEATIACEELGDEASVPYLAPLTEDPEPDVQLCAVHALGSIGGALARKALMRCIESSDDKVREAATEALSNMEAEENPSGFTLRN